MVHAILGRSLKRRSLHTDVHAMLQLNVLFLSYLVGQSNELMVVSLVHIGETWTRREVRSMQRMFGEEVDMVIDHHQVTDVKIRIHAARSVAHEQRPDAKLIHHALRKRHFLHRISLVEMESTFHGHDIFAAKLAEDQFAGMSFDSRNGKVGYVFIGEFVCVSYL